MHSSQDYSQQVQDAIDKRACERSLAYFIRYVFKHVYGLRWDNNWHHDCIIDMIGQLERREIPNAVINMPPRYGKTEISTIMWIAHTLIRNPRAEFIHTSFADNLVQTNSDKIRSILKHDAIQRHWRIKMRPSADSKGRWTTEEGGGLLAASTGGQITGFGAGVTNWLLNNPKAHLFDGAIIIDDPLKPDDADSDKLRGAVNSLISGTMSSRRNHNRVPMLINMQRLHEDDVSGYALAGNIMGEEFYHLKLPAISADGVPLWQNKHTLEQLELMRNSQPHVFAGQYQQEPYLQDGNVYKLEWFRRYDGVEPMHYYDKIVHSWDTAYKADQHNDPSACTVWGCTKAQDYLLHMINKRMEYPDLKRMIIKTAEDYPPHAVLIEDKASGQSLIQELRRDTRLPVIAIKPVSDKVTRAVTSTHYVEAGRVHLPIRSEWLYDLEHQLQHFPKSKNDDIVDSVSQFINWRTQNATVGDDVLYAWQELYG
jgi:predicted phage terminase large subunit-like protein